MAAPSYGSTRRLAAAKQHEFEVNSGFKHGYRNREDLTTLPPGVLIPGAQNILTNTNNRIAIRQGYALDGQANTDAAPIASAFDFETSAGLERHLRSGYLTSAGNDGKLQFRYIHSDGTVTWEDLMTNLSQVNFNYTTWWNDTQLISEALFVNGSSNIYAWNGAYSSFLSGTNLAGQISTINGQTFFGTTGISLGDSGDSGGVDYVVGDVITVTGGSGTAKVTVQAVGVGALKTTAITAAGTGYAPGDIILVTITAGPLVKIASLTVLTVGGGGDVLTYSIRQNGLGYTVGSGKATTSGGSGTGFTLNVTAVGNGITLWNFVSDAEHGSGYSAYPTVYPTTGGTGTNATAVALSVMSGTLTLEGTKTIAELGFNTGFSQSSGGERKLVIAGVTYSYGGDDNDSVIGNTTTFYGVTPDPSAIAASTLIIQKVVTYVNGTDLVNLPTTFKQTLISNLNQRIFLGQSSDSDTAYNGGKVWVSKFNDFKTYGTSQIANKVGSAFEIFTVNSPTAFIPQEQYMYITAGQDEWWNVSFELSSDLTFEIIHINRLNTTAQQASQSQLVTTKIANDILFLSHEPIIQSFGRIPDILQNTTPQMSDHSFTIVNDMNSYDFTNASLFYYRKFVYLAVPEEGLVLMYNMTDAQNPYWEAPQVLPISRFSIIDGELYGHSSLVSETYKLFTGYADRVTSTSKGHPIAAVWNFSYESYGSRFALKKATKMYVEGYINANTTLTTTLTYELDGCKTVKTFTLKGSDSQFVCIGTDESSLGKESLGKVKLGGDKLTTFNNLPPKFRWFPTFTNTDFFEASVAFSVLGLNERMELLAFGLATSGSSEIPVQKLD